MIVNGIVSVENTEHSMYAASEQSVQNTATHLSRRPRPVKGPVRCRSQSQRRNELAPHFLPVLTLHPGSFLFYVPRADIIMNAAGMADYASFFLWISL